MRNRSRVENIWTDFSMASLLLHTGLIFMWLECISWGESLAWVAMGLLIFVVAWSCTWPPEYPPSNV